MKKIVILLILLVGIGGIAYYKSNERNFRLSNSSASVKSREYLFPEFDINGIRKIHIKDDKNESNLTVQNDTWVINERGGYPINKEKLQTALMSLKYEKIKAGRRIGKDSWGKVGVNSPGDTSAFGVGTLVELFDDKGGLKHSFVLGGQVNSSGGGNEQMKMFGGATGNRFVRIKNEDPIWEIGDQLTDLVTPPDSWLDKVFLNVEKIKSIEVIATKPEDSWKASRPDAETTDFILEGAKPNEKIDNGKASLAALLSSPTFNDVQTKDKAAELLKDAVKAKIVTFDGFTYDVQVGKKKVGETDKYYLTTVVSAVFPKERAPVKDEKPEDKKKNDDAFAEEKKKLEEKLDSEKRFAGWVYEVTEYTVSTLLKKRSEILADPEKPGDPAAGAAVEGDNGLPNVRKMFPGLPMQPPAPSAPSAPASVPPPVPTVESSTPKALTEPAAPLPTSPKPEIKPEPTAPVVQPTKPVPAEEAKK